jgi:hypothetical protein
MTGTLVGLDFDNTIVNYDNLFYTLALEKKLIPENTPKTKVAVRDYLKKEGKENEWTKLQGIGYTNRIIGARPYEYVKNFLLECQKKNIPVCIVSHKTQYPIISEGREKHDMHAWAKKWLEENGFYDFVEEKNVFFELTKENKLARINSLKCNFFVDDLPEFLEMPGFDTHVNKILFDPESQYSPQGIETAKTWQEVETLIITRPIAKNLLIHAGIDEDFSIERMQGGKNNRVWKIDLDKKSLVLKSYFWSEHDKRDRLRAEYGFIKYLNEHKIKHAPQAFAMDEKNHCVLYGFIEGEKILPGHVTIKEIKQAYEFIHDINKKKQDAELLPNASEACFSIKAHLDIVDARIARLERTQNEQINGFVQVLRQDFSRHRERILNAQPDAEKELDKKEAILSPSDFGFHNALSYKGKLTFLDFEYAGWDDPAKMACDFFCQPTIPAPKEYFDEFTKEIFGHDKAGIERAKMLLPLYKIKWCCIMLNEFLPIERERREYAKSKVVDENLKSLQLQRTIHYYQN